MVHRKERENREEAYSGISARSFLVVVAILVAILVFCGSLSYVIPQGHFATDANQNIIPGTYEKGQVEGIALWRVITAPVRVLWSEDAVSIIVISNMMLQTSGKVVSASLVGSARQGFFLIPAVFILPALFDLFGLQMAQPVSDFCTMCMTIPLTVRFLREMEQNKT